MTRPRWMRKRSSITSLMDSEMRNAFNKGELSWSIGKRRKTMSFKKKDGTTDRYKYIRFFTSVFALIKESYTSVHKNLLTNKEKKFLLYGNDINILIAAVDAIYDKWDEIEQELINAEELRIDETTV